MDSSQLLGNRYLGERGGSTKLALRAVQRFGLEVWEVTLDGRVLHTFFSEQHARTRFTKLVRKLGMSA